jgi:hypothetical protein
MSIALEAKVAELEKEVEALKAQLGELVQARLEDRGEAWPDPQRRKPGPKPKDSNG